MPLAAVPLSGGTVPTALPLFLAATVIVVVVAPRLTRVADALAARTSLGRTIAGTLLLGASTSLPGIVVTVTATLRGDVALAAANAVGGVAAQTAFLALADVAYRRGSVTRDTATPAVLTQVALLLTLLAVPLFAVSAYSDVTVLGRVHPASLVLVVAYLVGLWFVRRQQDDGSQDDSRDESGDRSDDTSGADSEEGGDAAGDQPSIRSLWMRYAGYVAAIGVAGYLISTNVSPIAGSLGLTSVAAGALLTALATSTPELVTAISAARRGLPHLAVGDVVGGNTFDILFLVVADLVLATSLYAALGEPFVLLLAVAILLNALLMVAFVSGRRERRVSGANLLVLGTYVALAVLLVVAPGAGSSGGAGD